MHITEIAFPPRLDYTGTDTQAHTHCIAHFPPVNQYNRYNLIPSWRLLPIAIALKRWYGKNTFTTTLPNGDTTSVEVVFVQLLPCTHKLPRSEKRDCKSVEGEVRRCAEMVAVEVSTKGENFKRKQKQIRLYRFRSFINYRTINVMNLENLEKKKR